jgi:hypothetical protein
VATSSGGTNKKTGVTYVAFWAQPKLKTKRVRLLFVVVHNASLCFFEASDKKVVVGRRHLLAMDDDDQGRG